VEAARIESEARRHIPHQSFGANIMGQLITTLDETGVNQLFKKAWNRSNDIGPLEVGRQFGQDGASARVKLKATLKPRDFNQDDRPIDLRGSTQNPHARYSGLRLDLQVKLECRIDVAGFAANVNFDLTPAVATLGGSAWAGRENHTDHWQAWLELDASGTGVSIAAPNDLEARTRSALETIDVNPWQPGKQKLPASLVNAAAAAVQHAFAQAASGLSATATDAVRALTNGIRVRLGHKVPKQFDLPVPTGGTVQVVVTGLQIAIGANEVKVTATFE
jgi:hypothetical protein